MTNDGTRNDKTNSAALPLGAPGEECPSCGARLKGKFCHKYGEKKVKLKDFAMHRYLKQMFAHATHFDFSGCPLGWFETIPF
ncbi:MAG: hypothetical protein L6Q97_04870 [Thermoanaerobaculia bacterium]|nr:hypothetical protein [Thermoanaerobaculia bacterium]